MNTSAMLLLIALVLFVLAAFPPLLGTRRININLTALGLALLTAAFLLGGY